MATGNKSAEEFGYCFILGRKSGFGLVSFGGVLTTCSLTSSDSPAKWFDGVGCEVFMTRGTEIGLVCSMANNFGTDSKMGVKVVGFAGDVIVDLDNLPVLPVRCRYSCTSCSSLKCRGGTGSGLGKQVTVAPDGHLSRINRAQIDDCASRPMLALIR